MGNKGAKGSKGGKDGQKPPSHTEWPGISPKPSGPISGGGNSGGTGGNTAHTLPKLSETDYTFLTSQTGQSKDQIKQIFDQFMANNPDGKLDRREFIQLYTKLRPEPPDQLDEISQFVFRAFDSDKSGFIDFNEFMVRAFFKP